MKDSLFHDDHCTYTSKNKSPMLKQNMKISKGKVTVAKYHSLYNTITEQGELFNPHVHATYIPSKFLRKWEGSFEKLCVPSAKHAIYTGLRIEKMLLDKNTGRMTLQCLEEFERRGVSEALRFILSLSKHISECKPLAEFCPSPSLRHAVHLYHTSLQSMHINVNNNKIHNMTLCYSILPCAYTKLMRTGSGRISNQMTKYFKNTMPVCNSAKRKAADMYAQDPNLLNVYSDLLRYTAILADVYHEFGAYVTLKHFDSFGSRYNLSSKLRDDISGDVELYELGEIPKHYDVEPTISRLVDELSDEDIEHINDADMFRERGTDICQKKLASLRGTTSYFD